MDFYKIVEFPSKRGDIEIFPDFRVTHSKDLMTRGKGFYAIWDESAGLWSTDEYDVARLIDNDLQKYLDERGTNFQGRVKVKWVRDYSSGSWINFKNYVGKISDNAAQLDNKIAFLNTKVEKKDHISKRLPYNLEPGDYSAWDEILSTLYDPDERAKIEWAIGSIISGDSKSIQKFLVFYGDPGTGKSTVLDIIQKLFEGYYTVFEAKTLTNGSNLFATEVFKSNPLLAIQHDGDLSRIEDNSKLNSIVSHEEVIINEKFKSQYYQKANCMLFMATNKPVKITDAKAGLIRRLIDIRPSGRKIPFDRYNELKNEIDFQLPGIAWHCLEVYNMMGKNYYNNYRPIDMMYKTDPFFNFVEDSYDVFTRQEGITLKQAYSMYKEYCEMSNADYTLQMYKFREELKNYFSSFEERARVDDIPIRSYYSGFLKEKFDSEKRETEKMDISSKLTFRTATSILDHVLKDCKAQYATEDGKPKAKWSAVETTLSDIDTSILHYVKVPENHIVIDFDIKDENGNKSFEKNLEAAAKWPATYAELSKSGGGIHLHYNYLGDPKSLSRVYDKDIEIKVFTGNSSLRRKVSKCNNLPIATISSGLPLKEVKMVSEQTIKNEKALRALLRKNLNKEVHASTKSSIDFIFKLLDDAYSSGMHYDVTDMRPAILSFAAKSTNQADYCLKAVAKMKFKSEEATPDAPTSLSQSAIDDDAFDIVFFDIEVFPNLLLVCWKKIGENNPIHDLFNPSPEELEELFKMKLVGFNCRRYDNHVCYARSLGYSNEQIYMLSQRIINKSDNAMFSEAYNLSYTDIYDFAAAANKKSLKKLEIEMGIHHVELDIPWDKPVPKELWPKVAKYCHNDVNATEAAWYYLQADWVARCILADLAGMSVNSTTNELTTRIIFGHNRNPQDEFQYRDLSKPVKHLDPPVMNFLKTACPEMMAVKHGPDESLLPYFPGYSYENGVSTYKGIVTGEGGCVIAEEGVWYDVALLDITSMHPHSTIAECLFGVRYTKAFRDIVEGRVSIKHKAWEELNDMLDGKLLPYIELVKAGKISASQLADALKTAVNSVYGLTAAKFKNAFRDPRNIDNIVAKRGALFMIDLREEVIKRGYTVAHIKTDSIKIPNATPEIIKFVMDFGRLYGYTFEHEATYKKMCLVNDAVYIAQYEDKDVCMEKYGYVPGKNESHSLEWTATGTQFQIPYVFKTLFSHEPILFNDMCETKSVTSSLYLDMNENEPENHVYRFVGKTGAFCPIKPGKGGGELLRKVSEDKYAFAVGSKGYRWLEAEDVKNLNKEEDIDVSYYRSLVDDAIDSISKYVDFDDFINK